MLVVIIQAKLNDLKLSVLKVNKHAVMIVEI